MSNQELIVTGSGKGGGKSRPPIEGNDTLRSVQTVNILIAISEGEIDSIEDVYINRVSISNYDASYTVRTGTSNQTVIPGFKSAEMPLNNFAQQELLHDVPSAIYLVDELADRARITFFVPALSKFLSNGDLVGTSIAIAVEVSHDGNTYYEAARTKKTGKASSKYAWDIVVPRPAGIIPNNYWYIRLRRTTPNADTNKKSNKTFVGAITQIYDSVLTYPGTALVGIVAKDAEQFGGQIQEITIKGKFIKVRVPNNYNPVTRVYTGIWNLGFDPVKKFTANVAWVIFHVLHDSTCLDIPEYDIDKASFYALSQYADQLVTDGKGGFIPRYHMGFQFMPRENVGSFLQTLLSLCNGNLSTNEFGQITIIYDAPNQQPSKIITNANVIGGIFNYYSNDLEGRTTQVNVTFNDFERFASSNTTSIPDSTPTEFEQNLINRYGLQPSDIVLLGCTNESQALRKARWALYTNCSTTKFVSFKIFLQGLTFYYGEIDKIMDSENRLVTQHGVIKSFVYAAGSTFLTLDREYVLSDHPWSISFTGADGKTLYEKNIAERNLTTNVVSFVGSTAPYVGSVLILNGPIEEKLYKVISIKKEDNEYAITCLEHDEGKYNYIDNGIALPNPGKDFIDISLLTILPVFNLRAYPVSSTNGTLSKIELRVVWEWEDPNSELSPSYIASWRREDGDYVAVNKIEGLSFDIPDARPGIYEINVWAINTVSGLKSPVRNLIYPYKTEVAESSLLPPINARITGTSGLIYSSPEMSLSFDYNPLNDDVVGDSLYDYVIEIWDESTLKRTFTVRPNIYLGGLFKLTLAENISIFGSPRREYIIKLYSRDLTGEVSYPLVITVNNLVPSVPQQVTVSPGVGAAYFYIIFSNEPDIAGIRIWKGTTSNFIPSEGNLVYDGPDTAPVVSANAEVRETLYFKLAQYDTFGKDNLNITSSYSVTTISTIDIPYWTFTGLTFKQNDPTNNRVSWTSGAAYESGVLVSNILAGNALWVSEILYIYYPGTGNTLAYTNDLAVAVSGALILATYRGGTDLAVGNGKAYIDGGLILGNTVGANQLVTSTAVITGTAQISNGIINTAHIQDAAITNAKIGDAIQSTVYSWVPGNYTGWRIDKSGYIQATSITIRNPQGELVFSSGTGMEWDYINQKPADEDILNTYNPSTDNIVVDSNFAKAAVGRNTWSLTSGTATITSLQGENSTPGLRLTSLFGTSPSATATTYSQVSKDETFFYSARIFISSDFNGTFSLQLKNYDVNKSFLSTNSTQLALNPKSVWVTVRGSITCTATNVSYILPQLIISNTATLGYCLCSGLMLTRAEINATSGAPAGTFVNGVPVATITTAVTNFNASNDRNATAIIAPTINTNGTAIDHTIQSNGTADISFEWNWAGNEGDIDGFLIYIRQSANPTVYTFGNNTLEETVYPVPANKRVFIFFGTVADKYYTFGVQAYRSVDKDVNSLGIIRSTLVKATGSDENPYRPSASIAFTGNITGTVNGIPATDVNVWNSISGTGKPQNNATVGATWGDNITNQPSDDAILNTGPNLITNPDLFNYTSSTCPGWVIQASGSILADFRNIPGSGTPVPWNIYQPLFYVDTSYYSDVNASARLLYGDYIPIDIGKSYTLSCWNITLFTPSKIRLQIDCYDTNKVYLSSRSFDLDTVVSTWKEYSYVFNSSYPVGTVYVRPIIRPILVPASSLGQSRTTRFVFNQGTVVTKNTIPLDYSVLNSNNPISPENISTYIKSAAIGEAYIANAAISNAKIGNAEIDTLKVAGEAITATRSAYQSTYISITTPSAWFTIQTLPTGILNVTENIKINIRASTFLTYDLSGGGGDYARSIRLLENDIAICTIDDFMMFEKAILVLPEQVRTVPANTINTYKLQLYVGDAYADRRAYHRGIVISATKR